jgi:hypothetical protein
MMIVLKFFLSAVLSLCLIEWTFADPCTDLYRAIEALIPAVQNSGKKIDQAMSAQQVADAINTYADAAEKLGATIQRLRPELEKLPTNPPEACAAANQRLAAFQPQINAVIDKMDYKRRRYHADPGVTNAWMRVTKITAG